jgi:hypothetical protein
MRIECRITDPVLTDKPVYRNQALGDGIDCEEKTFKSHGAEQHRAVRGNKAWRGDFIAVQSQSSFGYGPYVSLPASDDDALRTSGLELKPFRQRSGHHAERSAGVHQKLNFFYKSRWAGQMSFDVEQSHLKYLVENRLIVAQSKNNATTMITQDKKREGNWEQGKFAVGSQLRSRESRRRAGWSKDKSQIAA